MGGLCLVIVVVVFFTSLCQAFLFFSIVCIYTQFFICPWLVWTIYSMWWRQKKRRERKKNPEMLVLSFLYVCLKYRWKKKPFNHSTWLEQIWWTIIIVRSNKDSFEWNHKEQKATARTFSLHFFFCWTTDGLGQ